MIRFISARFQRIAVVCTLVAALNARAGLVENKPEPSLVPETPKLVNPGFEADPPLSGWAYPGWPLFRATAASQGRTGQRCALLEDELGLTWGLFEQRVPVSSGAYEVEVWVRLAGGSAFLWVEGLDADEKVLWQRRGEVVSSHRLNPLVPHFVPANYMQGSDQWQPLWIRVEVQPPAKYLNVKFGSYFAPGRMWFDDVAIKPAGSLPQASGR